MNSQVCVHCNNKKPITNSNRLVIENCGHVKCMDCLLDEKSGCLACIKEKDPKGKYESYDDGPDTEELVADSDSLLTVLPIVYEPHEPDKKKKPETSHINIETDANGRCYVCTVCKKKFHARSQVAYHAYCNGQRKPYQCPECNKSFASHSHYKYHMRVHRNERTYSCEQCGDSFFQKSKLQRHMLKHTKEKKYVCTECNKAFNNLTSLRKHGLTHTEERPFTCSTCGLRFRDGSNYRKHVAKHDEKKCSCLVCGREVGSRRALQAHARAQHERRAHQCPRCPQAFHSGKDMRRHAAVHTDSKPFRCKVCNRRFRRKDNLERHIRNTHPDYVPATAVECDENALKEITDTGVNGHAKNIESKPEDVYKSEKNKLEILNPLPPLPQEVIQKHMRTEVNENVSQNNQEKEKDITDKSYILEANHARQSVIFGPVKRESEKKPSENEYVHKIRKAHSMVSQKDIPLPPIDEKKIIELEHKTNLNILDLGAPPKNMEPYKKILSERSEKEGMGIEEDGMKVQAAHPKMHWRRKMKLNIN